MEKRKRLKTHGIIRYKQEYDAEKWYIVTKNIMKFDLSVNFCIVCELLQTADDFHAGW